MTEQGRRTITALHAVFGRTACISRGCSSSPAQVGVARVQSCPPITEEEAYPVLAPNYFGGGSNKFNLGLSHQQAGLSSSSCGSTSLVGAFRFGVQVHGAAAVSAYAPKSPGPRLRRAELVYQMRRSSFHAAPCQAAAPCHWAHPPAPGAWAAGAVRPGGGRGCAAAGPAARCAPLPRPGAAAA